MTSISISYDSYLTEEKLIGIFIKIQETSDFDIKTNFKFEKFRADLVVSTKEHNFLIEFDGYTHYIKSSIVL